MNHRQKEFASPSILHDLSDSTDGSYANFKNYLSRSGDDDCESSNNDTKNAQGKKRKNILPTSPPTRSKATKLFDRLPSDVQRVRRSRLHQFQLDLQKEAEEQLESSPNLEYSTSGVTTRSRLKNTSAGTPKDGSLIEKSTEKASKRKDKSCENIERNQFEEETEPDDNAGGNESDVQDEESVHALNEDEAALLLQHLDQEIIRDSINNEVVVINCDSNVEEKEERLNRNKIEKSKPSKRKRTYNFPNVSKRSTRMPSINSDTDSTSSMISNTSRYGRMRTASSSYVQATMFPVSTTKTEEKFKQKASSFINSQKCRSKSLSTFSKSSSIDETKISSPPRNKKSVSKQSVNKITPKKGENVKTSRATPTSMITSWSSHQNLSRNSSHEAEKSDPTDSFTPSPSVLKKSVNKITPEKTGNIKTRRPTPTSLIASRTSLQSLGENNSHEAEKSDPTEIFSPPSAFKKPVHPVSPTKSGNSKIRRDLITLRSSRENLSRSSFHEEETEQLHDDDVVRISDFDDLFKKPTNLPSCSRNYVSTLKSTPKRLNKSPETGKVCQENEDLMLRGNSTEDVFKKPMMVLSNRSKSGSRISNSEISPIVVLDNVLLNDSPSRRPIELVKPSSSLHNLDRDSSMMGSSYSSVSQRTFQAVDDNFGIFDSRRRKPDQSKLHAVVNDNVISLKWFAPPPNLDVELSNGTNMHCSLPDFKQYFSTSSAGYLKIEGGGENSMQILKKCYMLYKVEKGEAIVRLPERTRVAQVGSTFFIPQGAEYTIRNTSVEEDLILFFVKMSPPT